MVSPLLATGSNLPEVRDWELSSGAFFAGGDREIYRPVAVIGDEVRNRVFGERTPIGHFLQIDTELFQIIGVMEEKGGVWDTELDRTVFVPLGSGSARLIGRWVLDSITVEVADPQLVEQTARSVKHVLESWHGENTIEVTLNAQLLKASSEILGTLSLLLGSVAGISLLVGGVGMMNMLLTSVAERTREIGVRMVVGARRSDILRQFLAEAIVVTLAGAFIGLIVGFVGGNLILRYSGGAPLFTLEPIVVALSSAMLIAVVFGYAPARRAVHMHPAQALVVE